MENLIITAKEERPYFPVVEFKTDGHLNIIGASYMENAFEFYDILLNWLEEFMESKQDIMLDITMEYFNTSSSKCLNNLFLLLDDYYEEGAKVNVNWYYNEGDIDAVSEGSEFKEEFSFPFEVILLENKMASQIVA